MKRENILKNAGYWITHIQLALYNCAFKFMKTKGMNRTQLAAHLGVTKGYVTQLLNGDYDHKLSKLVELSLSFGYVPKIDFVPVEKYCLEDGFIQDSRRWKECEYKALDIQIKEKSCAIEEYCQISAINKSVA